MSEKPAPAETKPAIRADVLALRLLIKNTRKLMTYTALFAVLFIVLSGFVDILTTLPKFANDSLTGLALTDLGLFLAGMLIMAGIINDYAKKLYALNRPNVVVVATPVVPPQTNVVPVVQPTTV